MGTKTCRKCGDTKPLSGFYAQPRNKGGLHHYCKECMDQAQRRWRRQNRDYLNQQQRERYAVQREADSSV